MQNLSPTLGVAIGATDNHKKVRLPNKKHKGSLGESANKAAYRYGIATGVEQHNFFSAPLSHVPQVFRDKTGVITIINIVSFSTSVPP
jgi:hypothetical protein